jgi:ABC-type polar amino acid transport system ATPase subunit
MQTPTKLPVINPGKRCVTVGRTGSGKSTWARWMLKRSPLKWVIIDLKIDEGFNKFTVIEDLPDANKILKVFETSQ